MADSSANAIPEVDTDADSQDTVAHAVRNSLPQPARDLEPQQSEFDEQTLNQVRAFREKLKCGKPTDCFLPRLLALI